MSIFNRITSKAERAYQQREAREWPQVAPYAMQCGGADYVKSERHKNFFKSAAEFPAVADVVAVRVMPSGDGGFTIGLVDVDGKVCTFWIANADLPQRKPLIDGAHQGYSRSEIEFPVRSISNY